MKNHFIYLFLLLLLISCEREKIQAGINTTATGKITDYQGSSIENVSVKIGEYKSNFVSDGGLQDYFSRYVASTLTDTNGKYQLSFVTTGEGTLYKIMLDNDPVDQSYTGFYDPVTITKIGGVFEFNYNQFAKLYPCDVTVTVNELTIFPVSVSHDTTKDPMGIQQQIYSSGIFSKRIYIIKEIIQKLNFFRIKPDGGIQKAMLTFPASNTTEITTQQLTLNEADFVDIP